MINPFKPDTPSYNHVARKQKLEDKILKGELVMDWRGSCDNGCKTQITFQYTMEEEFSEDSYCLECLYKELENESNQSNRLQTTKE